MIQQVSGRNLSIAEATDARYASLGLDGMT